MVGLGGQHRAWRHGGADDHEGHVLGGLALVEGDDHPQVPRVPVRPGQDLRHPALQVGIGSGQGAVVGVVGVAGHDHRQVGQGPGRDVAGQVAPRGGAHGLVELGAQGGLGGEVQPGVVPVVARGRAVGVHAVLVELGRAPRPDGLAEDGGPGLGALAGPGIGDPAGGRPLARDDGDVVALRGMGHPGVGGGLAVVAGQRRQVRHPGVGRGLGGVLQHVDRQLGDGPGGGGRVDTMDGRQAGGQQTGGQQAPAQLAGGFLGETPEGIGLLRHFSGRKYAHPPGGAPLRVARAVARLRTRWRTRA